MESAAHAQQWARGLVLVKVASSVQPAEELARTF
jgi:hypothetical protein